MRKRTAGPTLLLACLVIFALAPAAAAQLPLDPTAGIDDPLGGTTDGSASDPNGSDGSSSGGGVGDVVGGIGSTFDGDEDTQSDGSPADPKIIDQITDEVDDTVNNPQETINETTEDPSGSVGGTVGGIGHAAEDDVKDVSKTLSDKGGRSKKGKTADGITTGSGRFETEAYHDKVFAAGLAAREADAKNRAPSRPTYGTEAVESVGTTGVIAQIGRVAAEAAEQAAFPLLLTLLVVGFLVGQNRIDSRDPKLALAPIDSDQDLLSFT